MSVRWPGIALASMSAFKTVVSIALRHRWVECRNRPDSVPQPLRVVVQKDCRLEGGNLSQAMRTFVLISVATRLCRTLRSRRGSLLGVRSLLAVSGRGVLSALVVRASHCSRCRHAHKNGKRDRELHLSLPMATDPSASAHYHLPRRMIIPLISVRPSTAPIGNEPANRHGVPVPIHTRSGRYHSEGISASGNAPETPMADPGRFPSIPDPKPSAAARRRRRPRRARFPLRG